MKCTCSTWQSMSIRDWPSYEELRKNNAIVQSVQVLRAQLARVLSCEGANHDRGIGLYTDFEFSDAWPRSRSILKCNGISQRLIISLTCSVQDQDPNPTRLFEFVLPNEDNLQVPEEEQLCHTCWEKYEKRSNPSAELRRWAETDYLCSALMDLDDQPKSTGTELDD